MGHALHDLAKYNAWATTQVLDYCQGLDKPTLNATVPGTYGTIIKTLRHLITSEASYLFRLTGAWCTHPWRQEYEYEVGLDMLAEGWRAGKDLGAVHHRWGGGYGATG